MKTSQAQTENVQICTITLFDHDLEVPSYRVASQSTNYLPAAAPLTPVKLETPMLSRVSWKGSEMCFFSRAIRVVPSRLAWDALSA